LGGLGFDTVKIHNLYVVRDTRLGQLFVEGRFEPISRVEYVDLLVAFLEELPPYVVVERISGDAPDDSFLAPAWSREKSLLRRLVEQTLVERETYQGKKYRPDSEE
jgi:uncharacterized protein